MVGLYGRRGFTPLGGKGWSGDGKQAMVTSQGKLKRFNGYKFTFAYSLLTQF